MSLGHINFPSPLGVQCRLSPAFSSPDSMWIIESYEAPNGLKIWCIDSKPVLNTLRGGPEATTHRFIVQSRGFIDITTHTTDKSFIDINGQPLLFPSSSRLGCDILRVSLVMDSPHTFTFSVSTRISDLSSDHPYDCGQATARYSFTPFKPLPQISPDDIQCLRHFISAEYVPYQASLSERGRTDVEIRELGSHIFPWTPYSYELSLSIYDWTTASFARLVFFKVFQYTSSHQGLDLPSIARMIWESDWTSFNPSDPTYMNSFMMKPAASLKDVQDQLEDVKERLHRLSEVENAILTAALYSLPRSCTHSRPQLFSGQPDIRQMGLNRFGVEFLEFPGSSDTTHSLEVNFHEALASFMSPGSVITTKMPWSFTDSVEVAMTYSNGILLVVEPEPGAVVWDTAAYVTEFSNEETKTEYVFAPRSQFRVLEVEERGKLVEIRLQVYVKTVDNGLNEPHRKEWNESCMHTAVGRIQGENPDKPLRVWRFVGGMLSFIGIIYILIRTALYDE